MGARTLRWHTLATAVCLALVGSLLQSCSEINDKQIVRIFESHRAALDRIAKIGLSSDLSCNATDREVKCNNATAQPIFEALSREAGVKAIRASGSLLRRPERSESRLCEVLC